MPKNCSRHLGYISEQNKYFFLAVNGGGKEVKIPKNE